MVKANLPIFKRALRQFWMGNEKDWQCYYWFHGPDYNYYHPIKNSTRAPDRVALGCDPFGVVEVQRIVDRAIRFLHTHPFRLQKLSGTPQVPLEVAIIIAETIYHDDNYDMDSVTDTHNLLIAF